MVRLIKAYGGYVAGSIVRLTTDTENTLIAQGIAVDSAGPVTPGAVTTTLPAGRAGIAAGAASVVVTNSSFTTESSIFACLSNATADGTALYVTRIVPADGYVTFYVNANATAAIAIDWAVVGPYGGMTNNTN